MKKIYFFTFSYPYSIDFSWKRNELSELSRFFDVTVIPFIYQKTCSLQNIPAGIKVVPPLLDKLTDSSLNQFLAFLKSKRRLMYFREFVYQKVYLKKKWIIEWLTALDRTERLLKHPLLKELLVKNPENNNAILYFYWGNGSSQIVPVAKKFGFNKIVVRFHGFDLYEERQGGYIPFRRDLLKNIDFAIPISEHGERYLRSRYSDIRFKSKVLRLGSLNNGMSKPSQDGKFRIVSCSNVIDLKRLHLIAAALKFIGSEVNWTHLGDGEKFEGLKKKVATLPSNISVHLAGRVSPAEVLDYYSNNPVDLFINVSTTEGVPVSIMEAFSAGIPVYATNVGGTSEIVNASNGKLLDKDISPEQLANELKEFSLLKTDIKSEFRKNASQTYFDKCSFTKLSDDLIRFLST
jgi:colanic acid/amylovoran biosynthesis glycosyltransferase